MKVSITSNKLFNLSNSESNLSHLVNTFDALNEIREQSLTTSREIVRDCSKSIRYMHRNDAKGSEEYINSAKEKIDKLHFGELLNEHHSILHKILNISTPKIELMLKSALQVGAYGGKINGSGGLG